MKDVLQKKDVPQHHHWAAIVFGSMWVDDGYGESYHKPCLNYIAFEDKKAMETWVIAMETKTGNREAYQIIESQPQQVKLKASVELTPTTKGRNED